MSNDNLVYVGGGKLGHGGHGHQESTRHTSDCLYVLAGRMDQALDFARHKGVARNKCMLFSNEDQFRGMDFRGKRLFVCGTASHRHNYEKLLNAARERGFDIEYVRDTPAA